MTSISSKQKIGNCQGRGAKKNKAKLGKGWPGMHMRWLGLGVGFERRVGTTHRRALAHSEPLTPNPIRHTLTSSHREASRCATFKKTSSITFRSTSGWEEIAGRSEGAGFCLSFPS